MDLRSIASTAPSAGAPLNVGSKVEFRIAVSYSMTFAKSGVIALAF
jgi:hypothetical protein